MSLYSKAFWLPMAAAVLFSLTSSSCGQHQSSRAP